MLRYLGLGERRYRSHPVQPMARAYWEFQAVTAGRIAPLVAGAAPTRARARRLWVFPPGHRHGWTGDDRPGRVAVFHFDAAPEPLRAIALASGGLEVALDVEEASRLDALARELQPHVAQATALTALSEQRALLELCLIALRRLPERVLPRPAPAPRRVVEAALAWHGEHLAEGPGVAEVARAVGVSIAHLRRLFRAALGRSPAHALREAAATRADDLMRDGTLSLERVARLCGYAGGAAFSRAFKAARGAPPSRWRRR